MHLLSVRGRSGAVGGQKEYYDEETGMHYNWNRYYDPESGRYSQTDPIGLRGGINLYAYVKYNPIISFDIYGLFDIYIGGFADDDYRNVYDYWKLHGGENSAYFEHHQWKSIYKKIDELCCNNSKEEINLIGHSYGADRAAFTALRYKGKCKINKLITIDPVSLYKPNFEKIKQNTNLWINVNAQPSVPNNSDTIAWIGGKWKDAPKEFADHHIVVDTNHANFSDMMHAISLKHIKH